MRLDDKRKVIEALLCVPGDPIAIVHDAAEWLGFGRSGRICRLAYVARDAAARQMAAIGRYNAGSNEDFDSACILAAYQIIESSPALRREWFGAR